MKEEWGVFEVEKNDRVEEIHVMPCDKEGHSIYPLDSTALTVKEIVEPAYLNAEDFLPLVYVHVPLQ